MLLPFLGTIDKTKKNKQVLDKLQVERERGITVKAQTATLFYNFEGKQYLLNLIDTPVSFRLTSQKLLKLVLLIFQTKFSHLGAEFVHLPLVFVFSFFGVSVAYFRCFHNFPPAHILQVFVMSDD